MLIECPNCSLEQPLDQYCAGCGKQLDKLLVEKKRRRSAMVKKTNFVIAFICISFLSGSFYYYSNLNSNQSILSGPIVSKEEDAVRLRLPRTKIIHDKSSLRMETSGSYATESPGHKKSTSPNKFLKSKALKKVAKKNSPVESPSKEIESFYFVSLENCPESTSSGELSLKQRSELLTCASVHFQTSNLSPKPQSNFSETLDEASSFSNQIEIKVKKFIIELNFNLSRGDELETFQQTLPLNTESNSAATIWPNTGHDLGSTEAPSPEMLSSYTSSSLFKLYEDESDIPKLYFLATYR